MDMVFREARDEDQDRALALAIKAAGNVVLAEFLQNEKLYDAEGATQPSQPFEIRKIVQPIDIVREASVATAPLPVPKVPVRVSRYWAFVPDAGNAPSLPVVSFQMYALEAYPSLVNLLQKRAPPIVGLPPTNLQLSAMGRAERVVLMVRDCFKANPALADAIIDGHSDDDRATNGSPQLLDRLIQMYAADDSRFLNFYGPPGTIETTAYHQIISRNDNQHNTNQHNENQWVVADLSAFKNKAVFIGLSEREVPLKTDGFYTVYSRADGVDLNGVEIAATAFANILENRPLRTLSLVMQAGIFILCGCLLLAVCNFSSNIVSAGGAILFGLCYLSVSLFYFKSKGIWLPIVTIVAIQTPLVYFLGVFRRYRHVDEERKAIRHAFTFYLPTPLVDRIATEKKAVTADGHSAHGALICTDLSKYTSFSETIDPLSLNQLMHDYFEVLFRPVQENGGIISDLAGDSMMALWATKEPDLASRKYACDSAVQMVTALSEFWKNCPLPVNLATRIGIHYGHIHIGNVGAGNHYEYKATGDTVNTTARIENLNKHLKTHTLISADALAQVNGFLTRRVGTFLLSGKSRPVEVFELITRMENATDQQVALTHMFSDGLKAYMALSWEMALGIFNTILSRYPHDGPSIFYERLCRQFRQNPPASNWSSVIVTGKK